jgi:hypothetical protein
MRREEAKAPTLPTTGRIGHPGNLNQSLGIDVPQWYHSAVSVRQQNRRRRVGHPPVNDFGLSPTQVLFYLMWDWFDGGLRDDW